MTTLAPVSNDTSMHDSIGSSITIHARMTTLTPVSTIQARMTALASVSNDTSTHDIIASSV